MSAAVDLGRFRTMAPSVSNSTKSQSIVCPHCNRLESIPDGYALKAMVADRRTFCHSIINKHNGVILRRAAML
jgi:hypothetical protein